MTVGRARTPFFVTVDVLWGYAAAALFVQMFTAGDGRGPSIFAVAAAVVGSFALARLLQRTDLAETQMRAAGLVATIAAVWLIAYLQYAPDRWLWDVGWLGDLATSPVGTLEQNAEIAGGVIALAVLWIRGVQRGQVSAEFEDVLPVTAFGLVVVAAAAVFSPSARWPESFGLIALVYVVVALCTLALYQAPEPRTSLVRFATRWMPAVVPMVALAAMAALFVAAIDADELGIVAPVAEPAGSALRFVAYVIVAPFFIAVAYAFGAVAWLFGLLIGDAQPFEPAEIIGGEELLPEEEERETPGWVRIAGLIAAGGASLAIVAIALLIVWFAFRRFARRDLDERERRESVEPAYSLRDDLAGLFDAFTGRFRRRPSARHSGVAVRLLYFEMLDRALGEGVARPASATPLQFAPALDAHFRSDAPSSITRAFVDSRYGEHPVDEALVRELQTRWRATGA